MKVLSHVGAGTLIMFANMQLSLACHNTKLDLSVKRCRSGKPASEVSHRMLHMIQAPFRCLSCAANAPLDRSSLTLHCSLKCGIHNTPARLKQKQAGTENGKAAIPPSPDYEIRLPACCML